MGGTVVRAPYLTALIVLVSACGSPSGPSTIGGGTWGGDHVTLTVGTSSHLEFDCAHGDIPNPLTVDRGTISATGTFVREYGGPIRSDESLDIHPALYAGTVSGTSMQLSVKLADSGDLLGPFSLVRGAVGRVAKCL